MGEDRLPWLGLAWFHAFGSRTLWKLWKTSQHDGERAWRIDAKRLQKLGVPEKTAHEFVAWRGTVDFHIFDRRCTSEQVRFVMPSDKEYPPLFAQISDPPFGLFCRGAEIVTALPIGVVGTRGSTGYGIRATSQIVEPLASAGAEIVSGLALGIDGAAHIAALNTKSYTVAVLAGGINDNAVYPRQHVALAKRILEHNGTIVSEFPPGTEHFKFHFPLRNRIIAGLSRGVLVVEASEKSGSLITAKLALHENRDVFAVPGPITSVVSTGTHALLKSGAIPCTDAADILNHYNIPHERDPPKTPDLSGDECAVLDRITRPLHADEIVRETGMPSHVVGTILTNLEMYRLIGQEEPDVYSRTSPLK